MLCFVGIDTVLDVRLSAGNHRVDESGELVGGGFDGARFCHPGHARAVGCSPAQLALAWLLQRGEHVIPIPGTTSLDHLEEDLVAADVVVPEPTMRALDALINRHSVKGARYNAQSQSEVDTEQFAD